MAAPSAVNNRPAGANVDRRSKVSCSEALGELEKLHKDGLQVVWPCSRSRPEQPCLVGEPAMPAKKAKIASLPPEESEALEALEELHSLGLKVVWPHSHGSSAA